MRMDAAQNKGTEIDGRQERITREALKRRDDRGYEGRQSGHPVSQVIQQRNGLRPGRGGANRMLKPAGDYCHNFGTQPSPVEPPHGRPRQDCVAVLGALCDEQGRHARWRRLTDVIEGSVASPDIRVSAMLEFWLFTRQ